MNEKQTVSNDKPNGFGKWLGRGLALVLILLAAIALYVGVDDNQQSNPPAADSAQGIKIN